MEKDNKSKFVEDLDNKTFAIDPGIIEVSLALTAISFYFINVPEKSLNNLYFNMSFLVFIGSGLVSVALLFMYIFTWFAERLPHSGIASSVDNEVYTKYFKPLITSLIVLSYSALPILITTILILGIYSLDILSAIAFSITSLLCGIPLLVFFIVGAFLYIKFSFKIFAE